MAFWRGIKTLVTGGASFIGSHLVDRLLGAGAQVRVADDFSSGRRENIQGHLDRGDLELLEGDLRNSEQARRAVAGCQVVFHLAADHGGRGYVDLHQAGPASNLLLDGMVFHQALKAGVEKLVYASSGCVYPNSLQSDPSQEFYLTEDLVSPPYDADNLYGWAKLMAELTLQAYYREHGMAAANCRYFTVYGPRGLENHAVMAMIARAFIKQSPFQVWGDGTQVRNWTYVEDIVRGTMLAAEHIDDGGAVNLGTTERVRVIDAVRKVLEYSEHQAEIQFLPEMPTGPLNRVADHSKARRLLGWEPEWSFQGGLHQTMDWYFENRDFQQVRQSLKAQLTER